MWILVKEAGVPLPVPGDLLIIGAGASLAGDLPAAGLVLTVILVAGFIGASVQFFLFRTALRRPLLAALARLGIGTERIVLVVLAIAGLLALRMRTAPAQRADTFECWADCSCPACVAVVALGSVGPPGRG